MMIDGWDEYELEKRDVECKLFKEHFRLVEYYTRKYPGKPKHEIEIMADKKAKAKYRAELKSLFNKNLGLKLADKQKK